MGEKARLRAELHEAQQQRDRAFHERDVARAQVAALEAKAELTGRFSDWLDDLHRAVGL